MRCLQCATPMKAKREAVSYEAGGLRGVTLVDVPVYRCPRCGEREVSLPNLEGLHRALAAALARKPARLTPGEIRFLRKWLGWSGVACAAHLGVAPETVSRWEHGTVRMGLTAERFLRWLVLTRHARSQPPLDALAQMARTPMPARPVRLTLTSGHQWREVRPAAA